MNPNHWVDNGGDFSGDFVLGFRVLNDLFAIGELNGPNDAVNFRGRRHDVSGTGNTAGNHSEVCRYTSGVASTLNYIDLQFTSTDIGPATCTDTGVVP